MTKEEKEFLRDIVAFLQDAIEIEGIEFHSVKFTIAHDFSGFGKEGFLLKTHNWKERANKLKKAFNKAEGTV